VLEKLKRRAGPKSGGLVFLGARDGGKLCQTWINEQHRTIRDLLKLSKEFVPHSLRQRFGTLLGESGADAFTIMKLMGHSTIPFRNVMYIHPLSRRSVPLEGWTPLILGKLLEVHEVGILSGIPKALITPTVQ
jgi:integrase